MKTIAQLKTAEFLRACNKIRHNVSDFLEKTQVLELRKTMPELTGKETPEEKDKKFTEQGKKNIDAMLDRLLDDYAEDTAEFVELFIIKEEGDDKELDGVDIICSLFDLLSDEKVMSFLQSLASAALKAGQN